MTATEARDWLLRQIYMDRPATTPATWHYDVATAVNAALQEMYRSPAGESFSRQNWSFTTVPGTAAYTLADAVTQLLDDRTTIDHHPLREIEGPGNASQIGDRFGVPVLAGTRPRFFWVERSFRSQSAAEAHLLRMHLMPTPSATMTVRFVARTEPRRFSACDLDSDATVIPIPDSEVENLFLPIALWHLGSSVKMTSPVLQAKIDDRYARARAELGYVEPSAARRVNAA